VVALVGVAEVAQRDDAVGAGVEELEVVGDDDDDGSLAGELPELGGDAHEMAFVHT
jgi:hypothetical protein